MSGCFFGKVSIKMEHGVVEQFLECDNVPSAVIKDEVQVTTVNNSSPKSGTVDSRLRIESKAGMLVGNDKVEWCLTVAFRPRIKIESRNDSCGPKNSRNYLEQGSALELKVSDGFKVNKGDS
ncbi:hypothetical protein FQR65_LT18447 [Abscondita terminalis]|nr:hypothetical protein FQR65_LT18447 [Abscondita terminalis]